MFRLRISRRMALLLALLVLLFVLPCVLITKSWKCLLVAVAVAVLLVVIAEKRRQEDGETVEMQSTTPASQKSSDSSSTIQEMREKQCARHEFPAPPSDGSVFRGALAVEYPAGYQPQCYSHNAYSTPGVFDYDRAVRSAANVCVVPKPDNHTARMYNPVNQIPEDMIMHPLPDPTFQARHPMFDDALITDRSFLVATDPLRIMPQAPGQCI